MQKRRGKMKLSRNDELKQEIRICWICDTPYQLLNCINYVVHNKCENEIIDLYIGRQFKKVEEIEKRLKEENIFHSIFPFKPLRNDLGIRGIVCKLRGMANPEYHMKKMLLIDFENIPKQYDVIFMSVLTHFSVARTFLTGIETVYFYEDGIGSYYGNLARKRIIIQLIYLIFGYNTKKLEPKALYLNNVQFCENKMKCKVYSLPKYIEKESEINKLLCRIFDYKNNNYYKTFQYIYLMQPNDLQNNIVNEINESILKIFYNCGKNVLVRTHPRQEKVNTIGLEVDKSQDMWELVCAEEITEQHTLIAFFSTAQLVPKLIYDKEPTLIFIYKLCPQMFYPKTYKHISGLVEKIRKIYRNPSKVKVLNSIEELEQVFN